MNWVANLFSRHGRNIHLGLLVVLSLVLITNFPQINRPVSNAVLATLYYPFFKIKGSYTRVVSVAAERDHLREALVEASARLSMCAEAQLENERLRAALGFEPPPGYRLVPAKVVYVLGFGQRLPIAATINKGSNDSVFFDLPIINKDGLIGRVSAASANFATVQLLTDPSNRVAARVVSSREMGLVKYLAQGKMILDNFPRQGAISAGDTVISSGLGGIYPGGLKIGIVAAVSRPKDDPFCDVTLEAAANFRSLEEVFVLKPEQQ